MQVKCKYCGNEISDNDRMCPFCGAPVQTWAAIGSIIVCTCITYLR